MKKLEKKEIIDKERKMDLCLSNSRLDENIIFNSLNKKIIIDRISIMANANFDVIEKIGNNYNPKSYPYENPYYCEFHYLGKIYIEIDKRSLYHTQSNIRIDFNPSFLTTEEQDQFINEVLSELWSYKISRLDVAFNINVDCSNHLLHEPYNRYVMEFKTQTDYVSQILESKYLGSPRSKKQIRLYDKKKELSQRKKIFIENKHLWRLEFQYRGKAVDEWYRSLDGVLFLVYDLSKISDPFERCALYGALHGINVLDDKTNYYKKKLRDWVKQVDSRNLGLELQNKLEANRNRLSSEIEVLTGLSFERLGTLRPKYNMAG